MLPETTPNRLLAGQTFDVPDMAGKTGWRCPGHRLIVKLGGDLTDRVIDTSKCLLVFQIFGSRSQLLAVNPLEQINLPGFRYAVTFQGDEQLFRSGWYNSRHINAVMFQSSDPHELGIERRIRMVCVTMNPKRVTSRTIQRDSKHGVFP